MNATHVFRESDKRAALEQVLTERHVRARVARSATSFATSARWNWRGLGHTLHEYLIGVEALGRPNAYSTDEDSSVRRRAYALRRKLDEVYAVELAQAPIRIVVPKGSYVPIFVSRPQPARRARDAYRAQTPSWRGVRARWPGRA